MPGFRHLHEASRLTVSGPVGIRKEKHNDGKGLVNPKRSALAMRGMRLSMGVNCGIQDPMPAASLEVEMQDSHARGGGCRDRATKKEVG